MGGRVARIRSLLQRYRVDRRLPPEVRDLMVETARFRRDDKVRRWQSLVLPVLGAGRAERSDLAVGRCGARRIVTAGELTTSFHDLGHQNAGRVVDALEKAGISCFVVERHGAGFEFGIELGQRASALRALCVELDSVGSYVAWRDGRSQGLCPVSEMTRHRRIRRAREWKFFTAYSWGEVAVGEGTATAVTFWDTGTSGQLEKIGTRGQDRFHRDSAPVTALVEGREYPGVEAFPVGRSFDEFEGTVDVVYTWVDGSDPAWQSDFQAWAASDHGAPMSALDPARYRSRDELKYSLRSVWAYCGWVRNIYVVTSGQVPEWLVESDRIRVVSHADVLPPEALPTFNSHAIETALHHIEGLSEHFIYFNDDVFVGRPLRVEAFFTPQGLAKVFQSRARVQTVESCETVAVDTAARRGRELLRRRFGRDVSRKPEHAPFPLRKSVLDEIDVAYQDVVRATTLSRFRSASDLSIAASFGSYYALATSQAVHGELRNRYAPVESRRLAWELDRILLGDDVDTFCINESGHVEGDHSGREQRLAEFFERMFPVAAPWEKG